MGQADPGSGTSAGLNAASERARFSREIAAKNLKPLWERAIPPRPAGRAVPAIWRYSDLRLALLRAGELITAREAERRVLLLENPALPGTTFVAATLLAGMQLVLPGEVAPAHRHTPNALRFIVEGSGAYTTVDGERIAMNPGDFVVTPGWSWHDHGNLGTEPVIWMDGLDLPFAQFFGAHFREAYSRDTQTPEPAVERNRVFPYAAMRERLEALVRAAPIHASHGYEIRYADAQGADPMRTVAAFIRWLPGGFGGTDYRSTESRVFNVVEGKGDVTIGDASFGFAMHDVFVVPAWTPYRFRAETQCVLFSYSDRAAQEALGFYREALAASSS